MLKRVLIPVLMWALLASAVEGAQPELSADEPIAFDARAQTLTARGNARFVDRDTLFLADEIVFHRRENRVSARGNVEVSQPGFRLITEDLDYDTDTRRFRVGPFRAGFPPLFLEGDAIAGTREEIQFQAATLYFREPEPQNLRLRADSGQVQEEDRIALSGVGLGIGRLGTLPLPSFQRSSDVPPMDFRGELGYRQNLGVFSRARIIVPVSDHWGVGGNLDFYSSRGVLVGPALRYQRQQNAVDFIRGDLDTGYIHDGSRPRRGLDILGDDVPGDRAFAEARLLQRSGDFRLNLHANILSDSEILRDYRPDRYDRYQQPASFLDALYLGENWVAGFHARANFNRDFPMVERLPELRFDLLPSPVGETGFYHTLALHAINYRQQSLDPNYISSASAPFLDFEGPLPAGGIDLESSPQVIRTGAAWRIERPIALAHWLQFRPLAGVRFTHYDEGIGPRENQGAHYWRGELGADLTAHFHAQWDVTSRVWNIDGLRHIVRPVLRYRWQPVSGDPTEALPPYDVRTFLPTLPTIDLLDDRALDMAEERHLLRVGIENLLQTRRGGKTHTLARLNFYQDFAFAEQTHHSDVDAFYVQVGLEPASWLQIDLAQRVLTESFELDETRLLARIRSAERWQTEFAVDYLQGFISQYSARGYYQLTPTYGVLAGVRYDRREDRITRHYYGLRQRIGTSWQVEYSVIFNEGSTREDDFQIGIRVILASF